MISIILSSLYIPFSERQLLECEDAITPRLEKFDCFLTTIPGIGPILAATILSEIGEISSGAKWVIFASIDPSVKQSGECISHRNHMSKRGSPYLRRALWQAATGAVTRKLTSIFVNLFMYG